MKVRIIYKPNKSISVIYPAPKSRRSDESEEQWLERVFSKAMQGDFKELPYDDIDSSALPLSREHRDAWEGKKGRPVSINQAKVQEAEKEKTICAEQKRLLREQVVASLAVK